MTAVVLTKHNMISTIRDIIPPVSALLSPAFSSNISIDNIFHQTSGNFKPRLFRFFQCRVYQNIWWYRTTVGPRYIHYTLYTQLITPSPCFPLKDIYLFLSDKKVFWCHWNVERRQLDGFQWCNVVGWRGGGVWVTVVLNWLYRCK